MIFKLVLVRSFVWESGAQQLRGVLGRIQRHISGAWSHYSLPELGSQVFRRPLVITKIEDNLYFRDYIQHNRQGVHPIDTDDFDNKSYCYIFPNALSGDYVSEQAVAGPGYVIYIWTEDRI